MTVAEDEGSLAPQEVMADVRRVIDALDADIVLLLSLRQRQIERAARVKPGLGIPARVPERVDEVLANVVRSAQSRSLSPELAEKLWTQVIEWSIEYEERLMGLAAPRGEGSGRGRA